MSLIHPAISHNFEKMGYYPTDGYTLNTIIGAIEHNDDPNTVIFDPCCGEGIALQKLKRELCHYGKTFGVELDDERFQKSQAIIDHCIHADALNQVKYSRANASVLFLNPPYGQSSISERLEYAFIKKYIHSLMLDGLLVLVIPVQALDYKLAQYLCSHCDDVSYGLSPEQAFKQVIIIGRKIKMSQANNINERAREMVKAIEDNHYYQSPPDLYSIPSINKPFILNSTNLTVGSVSDVINARGVSTLWDSFKRDFTEIENTYRNPLMPLSDWHTAQAIISGMISGLVESENRRMIVKGTVKKKLPEATVTVNGDTSKYQQTEKFVPMIIGIDVTHGSEHFGQLYQIS